MALALGRIRTCHGLRFSISKHSIIQLHQIRPIHKSLSLFDRAATEHVTPTTVGDYASTLDFGVPGAPKGGVDPSSPYLLVRPWLGVQTMAHAFAIVREVEKRFGPLKDFRFVRDLDSKLQYQPYFFVEVESPEVLKEIVDNYVIEVPIPQLDPFKPGGVGLSDIQPYLLPRHENAPEGASGQKDRQGSRRDEVMHVALVRSAIKRTFVDRHRDVIPRPSQKNFAQAFVSWGGFANNNSSSSSFSSDSAAAVSKVPKTRTEAAARSMALALDRNRAILNIPLSHSPTTPLNGEPTPDVAISDILAGLSRTEALDAIMGRVHISPEQEVAESATSLAPASEVVKEGVEEEDSERERLLQKLAAHKARIAASEAAEAAARKLALEEAARAKREAKEVREAEHAKAREAAKMKKMERAEKAERTKEEADRAAAERKEKAERARAREARKLKVTSPERAHAGVTRATPDGVKEERGRAEVAEPEELERVDQRKEKETKEHEKKRQETFKHRLLGWATGQWR
ncbi:hypothetical protein BD410DRAFT_829977 [Rickenella mellea]|uniref:Uncharacterized protein n=1 Tax=Rickenella mellea TaxID=50990 RepID=A0A4Y7PXF3_9AGAM|nr:hypothetical protein BD410DRAFT_829977 [Rickenella mellea]